MHTEPISECSHNENQDKTTAIFQLNNFIKEIFIDVLSTTSIKF